MLRGKWEKKKKGSRVIVFDSLDTIFKLWKTDAESIIRVLNAKAASVSASPRDKLLRSLISGPIDADKLDYLFRDARELGLP